MKFILILLIACAACILAAPVAEEQEKEAESSIKSKRGLHLGYHAPLLTHSHYVAAPTVIHHAPLISHASVISHAPIIAHHPVASYHLPTYHSYHHF